MKKVLLLSHLLISCVLLWGQSSPGLFFSEYIEGSGNNQALEIFNAGTDTVYLDNFFLARSNDGSGWIYFKDFPSGAFLAPSSVWTLVNDQFDPLLFASALADEKTLSSFISFRGNDAVGLMKRAGNDTIPVDVIGQDLVNPGSGWDVAGVISATSNHTLIRKENITSGSTDWEVSRGTDPISSEWVVKNLDFTDSLGHHSYRPLVLVTGIQIQPENANLIDTEQGSLELHVIIYPEDASMKEVLWESSDPLIASVDHLGKVQAFNNGNCTILARAADGSGVTDSLLLTVINQTGLIPVSAIYLSSLSGTDSITENKGILQLLAAVFPPEASDRSLEWSVDDPLRASISETGTLTAINDGTVTVTARARDGSGISASIEITIIRQFAVVNDLLSLRNSFKNDNSVSYVTGEVTLSHRVPERNIYFFQDQDVGIEMIDESGIFSFDYQPGDVIKGLTGSMYDYFGMLIFVPSEDPGAPVESGRVLNPLEVSVSEFNSAFPQYESRLIRINQLSFDQAGEIFQADGNYTIRAGGESAILRTEFGSADYLSTIIPDSADVTGLAIRFGSTPKIAPRSLSDFSLYLPSDVSIFLKAEELQIIPFMSENTYLLKSDRVMKSVQIFDFQGRLIQTGTPYTSEFILKLEENQGIFLVKVFTSSKKVLTGKIVSGF